LTEQTTVGRMDGKADGRKRVDRAVVGLAVSRTAGWQRCWQGGWLTSVGRTVGWQDEW
jgi:hypothetical protein